MITNGGPIFTLHIEHDLLLTVCLPAPEVGELKDFFEGEVAAFEESPRFVALLPAATLACATPLGVLTGSNPLVVHSSTALLTLAISIQQSHILQPILEVFVLLA